MKWRFRWKVLGVALRFPQRTYGACTFPVLFWFLGRLRKASFIRTPERQRAEFLWGYLQRRTRFARSPVGRNGNATFWQIALSYAQANCVSQQAHTSRESISRCGRRHRRRREGTNVRSSFRDKNEENQRRKGSTRTRRQRGTRGKRCSRYTLIRYALQVLLLSLAFWSALLRRKENNCATTKHSQTTHSEWYKFGRNLLEEADEQKLKSERKQEKSVSRRKRMTVKFQTEEQTSRRRPVDGNNLSRNTMFEVILVSSWRNNETSLPREDRCYTWSSLIF